LSIVSKRSLKMGPHLDPLNVRFY